MKRFIILKNLEEFIGMVNTHSDIGEKCFCSRQNISNQLKNSNIVKAHNVKYLIIDKISAFDDLFPDISEYLSNRP